ncbi:unnamed protein product [Arctia plantaginis]|uniref:Uncharacterized protein n=1 Tax=Arctia plantaginis TaxID=874455 RepID=A0A8S1BI03_ARCPL|nr:unnamed protein product [Arctia plantaginis]
MGHSEERCTGERRIYLCSAMRPNTDPIRFATHKHKDSECERHDIHSLHPLRAAHNRPGYGVMLFRVAAAGAAVVREGRAFCRFAGDERIILNSQETIGASI